MTQAIGYIRCSTHEQADSGLGLTAQDERIRAYCTLKGLQLNEMVQDGDAHPILSQWDRFSRIEF